MGFKDPENAYKADVAGPVIHVMLQDLEIYQSRWYFERFEDNKPREFDVKKYDFTDEKTRDSLLEFIYKLEDILDDFQNNECKSFTKYHDAVSIMKLVIVYETPNIEETDAAKVTNSPN